MRRFEKLLGTWACYEEEKQYSILPEGIIYLENNII